MKGDAAVLGLGFGSGAAPEAAVYFSGKGLRAHDITTMMALDGGAPY